MSNKQKFSQEAYDRLTYEFEDLKTRGRIEIAQKIETARELGDLSENGDYHAAKEEQGKMEGRIAHLGQMIRDAEIVDIDADSGTVQTGTVVSVQYEGDDEVEKYLLGSIEEKREGLAVISPGSPLGKALLDQKVGETVTFDAPNGPLQVKIMAVEV